MPDMREPYAYISEEIGAHEWKALEARKEITRLTAVAEVHEIAARRLADALREQKDADAEREQDA